MMIFPFLSMLIPIFAGIGVLIVNPQDKRKIKLACVIAAVSVSAVFILITALTHGDNAITLIRFSESLSISFRTDSMALLFSAVTSVIWLLVGIYSIGYMKHEENENTFYGFMLIALGVLYSLYFADNLLTLYLCFELATLASMPLVLSSRTKEAIAAAQKYLFYSIGGAFIALFGVIVIYSKCANAGEMSFALIYKEYFLDLKGDNLTLVAIFCMIIGFGTKAGMYPMHGWLPTAHPVAPSPASALLSGLIAEAGIFAVIRVTKYTLPYRFFNGTWVQYAWLSLAILTVFLGSMMAYREKHIKKRLAYSTVSQVSYIMIGLACNSYMAFYGALLHYIFHAITKTALFMSAGSIIYSTGKTNVDELEGIGKNMPVTMWSYTLASLGLIGIPPACGFFSKYFLCVGALSEYEDLGGLRYVILAVLIISALLTAGYLLPLTVKGFFPKKDYVPVKQETPAVMFVPLLILGILTFASSLLVNNLLM